MTATTTSRLLLINVPNSQVLSAAPNAMASKSHAYNTFSLPLSMLYLYDAVKHLCNVDILDLNIYKPIDIDSCDPLFYIDIITQKLKSFKPAYVGISALTSYGMKDILQIAKTVKKDNENITIVIGGMHATLYYKEIIDNCRLIDIVVVGEGEDALRKIIEGEKLSKIQSIAFRDMSGNYCYNPRTTYIENLDNWDFKSYDKFNLEDYQPYDIDNWYDPRKLGIKNPTSILTSRSCPNKCNFCSMSKVMGLKCRMKSAQKTYAAIEYLYSCKDVNYFHIQDDNFTLNKRRVIEICNLIVKNRLRIYMDTPNGVMVSTLDEEVIDALYQAGLIKINLAIESGSEFIRNNVIKKRLSLDQLFKAVAAIRKYPEIYISSFFIVGFPEETLQTLEDTVNLIKELDIDKITLNKLAPLPGTNLFAQCIRDKLFTKEFNPDTAWENADYSSMSTFSNWHIKPYAIGLDTLDRYYETIISLSNEKSAYAHKKYNRVLANTNIPKNLEESEQ